MIMLVKITNENENSHNENNNKKTLVILVIIIKLIKTQCTQSAQISQKRDENNTKEYKKTNVLPRLSPQCLYRNPSTWVHDGQLYIAGPIEKVSVQSPKQGEYDCHHNLLLLFSSDFHKI